MRARTLCIPVCALALVVTACGSDDAATEPTDAPAESAAPVETTPSSDAPPSTDGTGSVAGTGSMPAEVAALIDEAATAYLTNAGANGGSAVYVAVSDPDQGDYVAAYGDAGVDGPAATTADSFRIGSITKSFTAAVILQLVDEGELSLGDTVEDVHPGLAVDFPDLAPITIEQLLGMTSGIPDFANVPESVVSGIIAESDRVWEPYELIEIGVGGDVEAPGTPGYSSTNYVALQLIAEELTGTSIEDLIDERLVEQDDLGNVFYPPNDDTDLPEPFTRGYVAGECVKEFAADGADVEDGTDTSDWSASGTQGAGQMTSDISALLGWAESMSGSDTLSDELAATRIESTNPVGNFDYGLGIFKAGTNWWGHTGEAIGWEAVQLHDPETGVSVAVAGNGCGGQFVGFFGIIDAVYPDGALLETLIASLSETAEPGTTTPDTTDGGSGTDENSETSSGDGGSAASEASGTVVMTVGGTTIEADIVQCTAAEPDVRFRAEGETAQIEVVAVGGGDTDVVVSGAYEFEGKGTATFDPDTSGIDQGNVMISGSGAQPDDSSPIEDFIVDARIRSC